MEHLFRSIMLAIALATILFFVITLIIELYIYIVIRRIEVKNFKESLAKNNFRLYQFVPSDNRLLYSFKPLEIKYWFNKQLINKYYR